MWHRQASNPKRILIINPFGIGDVLFTTPIIRAVRQAFPGCFLGYLCNQRTERVLRDNPHINELFIYEKDEVIRLWHSSKGRCLGHLGGLLRRLHSQRFDLVIDLSLGERYSFFLRLFGVPRLMGFNFRHRGRFLNEAYPIDGYQGEHVVEHYRRLLGFLGIRMVDVQLELALAAEDERWVDGWLSARGICPEELLVGIVPAGGASWGIDAPFRRWSFEGFAAVGDVLIERFGARVLLFGEPADVPVCATVARLMKKPPVDVSGQTNLAQFISFLSRLKLVICNDGGPLHLAVSQRVPTVSIFGPVDPNVYGPYAPNGPGHRVIARQELFCRPCYHQFRLPPCPYERSCLTGIEPADVLAQCESILNERRLRTAPTNA